MKKRQFKKNMKNKFESLKEGQGLIVSSDYTMHGGKVVQYHHLKIGTIANIIVDESSITGSLFCKGVDKHDGTLIKQYVRKEHILVK